MNNVITSLLKLTALAAGAALGVLLGRLYEEMQSARAQERSERDRSRYEQGLSAVERSREYPIWRSSEFEVRPEE